MALVTIDEVNEIVDVSTKRSEMSTFIETADLIVTESLAGQGLSAARLRQIELYLAAHFTTLAEERGGIIGSKTGESSEFYANKFGKGLALTRYGQQALVLDTSGRLASEGTALPKAQFRVV